MSRIHSPKTFESFYVLMQISTSSQLIWRLPACQNTMPNVDNTESHVHNHTSNRRTVDVTQNRSYTMPIQLNNPSQVSSNIARMVTNMIPQLEDIEAHLSDAPQLAQMARPSSGVTTAPRPSNPYLNQGRQRHSHHGRSHHSFQGHSRSLSHGQAIYNSLTAQVPQISALYPAYRNDAQGAQVDSDMSHPHHQQSVSENTAPLLGNAGTDHDFVIDFGGDNGNTLNQASLAQQDSNNNGHLPPSANNPLANVRSLWRASAGSIPFLVLLLVKILYDHRLGKIHKTSIYCHNIPTLIVQSVPSKSTFPVQFLGLYSTRTRCCKRF